MILFIGNDKYRKFIDSAAHDKNLCISSDISAEEADKVIVTDATKASIDAVRSAVVSGKPVLGVLDGYKAVAAVFGADIEDISTCEEGNQEWAVIDATSPVYLELESVIRVARGKPYAISEKTKPALIDCMSRAETGEIIALRSFTQPSEGEVDPSKPKEYANVYALNFDLTSPFTPDGLTIMKNFIEL